MTHDRLKYLSGEKRNSKNKRHNRYVADPGTILNFEMEIKMSWEKQKLSFIYINM